MAKQPFSPVSQLDHAIRAAGMSNYARNVFMDFPALRTIALNYTRYVTPIIDLDDGGNLLPLAIEKALINVVTNGHPRGFLGQLVETSRVLAGLKISVPNAKQKLWDIWDYDEPLMHWMRERDTSLLSISPRAIPVDEGRLILKMLANVATARDLKNADLFIDIRAAAR